MTYKQEVSNTPSGAIIIEGHVQGLANVRALGENGIPVYVVDKSCCIARYSKYCKKFYVCPDYKEDKLADFLIEIALNEGLRDWVLFPSNDHAVITLTRNKERLKPYYRFNALDDDQLFQIYNKSELSDIAHKLNIPVPIKYKFNSIGSDSFFPLIIKGKIGLNFFRVFKKKAFVVNSYEAYLELLDFIQPKFKLEDLLIQEFLPFNKNNRAVFCITFISNGEVKLHFMCQRIREHPFRNGTSTVLKAIFYPEVLEYTKQLAKGIRSTGIYEFEYLYNSNQKRFNLIEINPRTCIQIGLPVRLGCNFQMAFFLYWSSEEKVFECQDFTNAYWIHFWTDLFYGLWGFVKGEYTLKEILAPYRARRPIFAVFDIKDISPFIMETVLLPYLKVKRT